ncbi:peptidase M15A [Hylemonella gracilis str. Niagara R]|uniref:Peptidase M15A n=1 Tax=Hylemonella gracilis str. Niagara R TaxID=1458275 RepID=A0A016XKE9_9BURK|nr:D-Ala-D-Ala carboxypeptidase family metallohydrolase [Hylemonella gracilis]EYC51693.1 peptidase M15A [Hylemonella gracilis str. Niagara R]
MKLSPNFWLSEFTDSDTAERLGIDNTLPAELMAEARQTAAFMEQIRAHLSGVKEDDVPIDALSGYRCLALNRALKSDDGSDHRRMQAIDFIAPTFGSPLEICRALAPVVDRLGIGQLIYEHTWVHVSRRPQVKAFNRILTLAKAGGYLPGIVEAKA